MSDIKLFKITEKNAVEIQGKSAELEKYIQTYIENNLEQLFGIRFLATEHPTGKDHGGRIDSLGIDENGCPVIIEYKRSLNENVINQGLYYLDWLLDHKSEFELLTLKTLGQDASESIEWSGPRLLCIAGDFTKFDAHAVRQINRNIELIRYRYFGDDLLMFELVNAVSETKSTISNGKKSGRSKTVGASLESSSQEIQRLYQTIHDYLISLGDDVQMKEMKNYFAYKRIKNFACVEIYSQAKKIQIYTKVDPQNVKLEEGFTRDVTNIGHFGTGNLEITITSQGDFDRAKALLSQSYELA